jgi:ketosteroid isomerase-like protein
MLRTTVKGRDRNALKGEFRMGSRSPLCGVLAAALAVTASAPQRLPVESDQQVLIKLERSWNDAFYRKDVAFIANILADEFIATYDDGSRGDKAKELALVTEFNQQVESATQDEFTVKVYRDTAVVWFTLHLVGTKQGQRAELTLRYTDVWVIRDGGWVCVSTQSTRVNPKQAAACLRCFSMSDALTRFGENRRSTMGSL